MRPPDHFLEEACLRKDACGRSFFISNKVACDTQTGVTTIGLREDQGPELGQINKADSNLKAEIRRDNEIATASTLLRPVSTRRPVLHKASSCSQVHWGVTNRQHSIRIRAVSSHHP